MMDAVKNVRHIVSTGQRETLPQSNALAARGCVGACKSSDLLGTKKLGSFGDFVCGKDVHRRRQRALDIR